MFARVLVVDDEPIQREELAGMAAFLGYQTEIAADGLEALEKVESFRPNVVLSDLMMPRMDGFAFLKELGARGESAPVVVLTAFGSVDQAISIVRDLKAFWFLEKPIQPGVLRVLLERAIQQNHLIEESRRLNQQLSYEGILGELVGETAAMREMFGLIRQVAPTSASVLITGESGTGKELAARAIHNLSPRSSGPFIAVNCAALPESLMESELFGHENGAFTGAVERRSGCFEQAQNGTLLLDEIGDMPIGTQAKLLRVIEESKVRRLGGNHEIPISVRVLAATNKSPLKAVKDNHLREDLYYRLNVFNISLPPLRDRKPDLPLLAAALVRSLNKKHETRVTNLSPEVLQVFEANSWPGNVRELRNVLERAVILAREGEVQLHHLPKGFGTGEVIAVAVAEAVAPAAARPVAPIDDNTLHIKVGSTMDDVEEAYVRLTLKHTNNNKRRAANILGFCLRTLHSRLRAYEDKEARGKTREDAPAAMRAGGD